eukprot:785821-Pleurochrysis_carterae.AAC.2
MSAIGGLPQLRTLDCASCVHIGERGVQLLCAAAPTRLRAVDFSFCPHVGYGCVVALRRACPAIELVRRRGGGAGSSTESGRSKAGGGGWGCRKKGLVRVGRRGVRALQRGVRLGVGKLVIVWRQ